MSNRIASIATFTFLSKPFTIPRCDLVMYLIRTLPDLYFSIYLAKNDYLKSYYYLQFFLEKPQTNRQIATCGLWLPNSIQGYPWLRTGFKSVSDDKIKILEQICQNYPARVIEDCILNVQQFEKRIMFKIEISKKVRWRMEWKITPIIFNDNSISGLLGGKS